ncbi:MAG: phosphoribosyltransferase [Bacillota bacterium]
MLFQDRRHAGELLAEKLHSYRGSSPLILAVPRGGVSVAEPVRLALGSELDLIITRKIGAPMQPELALGAVSGDGAVMLNDQLVGQLRLSRAYIDRAALDEQAEIRRRLRAYRGERPLPEPKGRLVILIDDGVATGFTLFAAIKALRRQQPQKLVLAVPVGPPDTLNKLAGEVDDLCYLAAPPHFAAVGQFYRDFSQVEDDTVISILQEAWDLE